MRDELIIARPPAGRYIVAVSGGVDSMVLLYALRKQSDLDLVVAHFDHGVREDSSQDRELVVRMAAQYGLPFEYAVAQLPPDVSEAVARQARYDFLRQTQAKHTAQAIIMAHHQDDVIETACINLLRGTGRKGLTSLNSGVDIIRPLLGSTKGAIVRYAHHHHLVWHEDSTNANTAYLRNKLRLEILPRLTSAQRNQLLAIITNQAARNQSIDAEVAAWVKQHCEFTGSSVSVARYQLVMLPGEVAYEVLQHLCSRLSGHSLQSPAIWRGLEFVKSARPHKSHPLNTQLDIKIQPGGMISIIHK